MSNIPHMAAHRSKRAGKVECFNIIKRASAETQIPDTDLATLYSYFLPPAPRKTKDVFEWAALACDDSQSYAFCKFLEINKGMTIAANTKAAHIVYGNCGLEDGWYDVHKGSVGDDIAIMPDALSAISKSVSNGAWSSFDVDSLDVMDTPTGLAYILPWVRKGVNKKYLDSILPPLKDYSVSYSKDSSFSITGCVGGSLVTAVIMPFNLPEYANDSRD